MLFLITCYQKILSPALRQLLGMQTMCRFNPSCSEYAKLVIKKYGIIKGSYLSVIRILHCQPFISQNAKIKYQNYGVSL